MPYGRKGGRRYGKKRYSRSAKRSKYNKRYSKPSIETLHRGTLVPDRYFCRLRYSQTVDYRPTVASPTARQVFRANSLYDPDQSGIGGQPLGFDQLMSLYTYYRVYASSIKVQIMSLSTASSDFIKFSLYPTNISSLDNPTDIASEQPYSKNIFNSTANAGMNWLSNFMTTKRFLGLKDITQIDALAGTSGTNPSTQWYWVLDYGTVGGVNNINPGYFNVNITFYVEFYGRVDLTASS